MLKDERKIIFVCEFLSVCMLLFFTGNHSVNPTERLRDEDAVEILIFCFAFS